MTKETNSIVDQITAEILKTAPQQRVTGLHMTHEAFDAAQAEQNAGRSVPMIELRGGEYRFGAIPVTRVAHLPADAPNQSFMLITESYRNEDDQS